MSCHRNFVIVHIVLLFTLEGRRGLELPPQLDDQDLMKLKRIIKLNYHEKINLHTRPIYSLFSLTNNLYSTMFRLPNHFIIHF